MKKHHKYIGIVLLGLAAVTCTACGGDVATSSTGAGGKSDFLDVDSLVASVKPPAATTDTCVTAKQFCETLFDERYDGAQAADNIVNDKVNEILKGPESGKYSPSYKNCLQNLKDHYELMTPMLNVIPACQDMEGFVPGDSVYISLTYPERLQNILDAGTCNDGVPSHFKVTSVYLDEEKENNERYAKSFEKALKTHVNTIETNCGNQF